MTDGFMWARKFRPYIQGCDVVDIGCGTGAHGFGFLLAGARSYTGVDPFMDLRRQGIRNGRTGDWVEFGWTAEEIMAEVPRIRLLSKAFDSLNASETFDVAMLHKVTEHMPDLSAELGAVARRLRPGGQMIFNHHNFFCWNGHHAVPKRISDIDLSDPEQRQYVDWGHIGFEPPLGHDFLTNLNRLRIHEVREFTEKHFDIVQWDLIPSKAERRSGYTVRPFQPGTRVEPIGRSRRHRAGRA